MRDGEQAFEEFVAASADRLLLSAILLVGGDRAAGEDLLQGAFERCYLHWAKIATGNPEAYVRRALVNAATSRWRRLRARVPEVPLSWGGEPDAAAADHADRVAILDGLIRALRVLPPRQRAVVVLRYLDDLPESEVAAVLGCSIGSVRSQASRGLARLRDSEHLHTLSADRPVGPHPGGPELPASADVLTNGSRRGGPAGSHRSTTPRTAASQRADKEGQR